MGTASATIANCANPSAAAAGRSNTQGGYIAAAVRAVFPQDAVKTFARLTGLSFGASNKKVHGQREFSADELAVMLRTERGFELLAAIMADAKPKWWVLCSAFMEVRDAQRLQAQARTRIRRAMRSALDADTDITAAIARADALSDEEFHRPHVDALSAMARVPDRSMAEPAKKGRP